MKHRELFGQTIIFVLVLLVFTGCQDTSVENATAQTLRIDVTSTSSDDATSIPVTPTATSVPATPTPQVAIGVPVSRDGWQVIVNASSQEESLSRSSLTIMPGGGLGIQATTHYPGSGRIFLVLNTTIYDLVPYDRESLTTEDVTLISANGTSYQAGELSEPPGEFVFQVETEEIEQTFSFQFRDLPSIPFTVGQEAEGLPRTEIGVTGGVLPFNCLVEDTDFQNSPVFLRQDGDGLVLGINSLVNEDSVPVCTDLGFGNLQWSSDGASLLDITPQQGWSSLYLVEPEGEVYILVENGLSSEARFDPSGHYVLFMTTQIGETTKELYVFDREKSTTTRLYSGTRLTFDFLTDGRLVVDYRESEDGERQYVIGSADGLTMEEVGLPEDLAGFATLTPDGQHLIYRDFDMALFSLNLYFSDLNGNNARLLAAADGTLNYTISRNGSSILTVAEVGEVGKQAELHNLVSGESWIIATNVDAVMAGFSTDEHWVAITTLTSGYYTLYIANTTGGDVLTIDNGINALFSPDSTQLVYTAIGPDGEMEMFVMKLEDAAAQFVGPGMLLGWYPAIP